jgi:endonuclease/exonuclease/phosphatase family metal-dependent hydrolase
MATFTTQHPGQRVDYIFTHGVDRRHIADAWIERDRLATYASDHYPVGAEIRD